MGRQVRRVPEGFDWPLNKVWAGFIQPEWLHEDTCPDCENGYSPAAEQFFNEWYGYVPFDPFSTGSAPFTVDTPEVRSFAARNVSQSPQYYGRGEEAIVREAERLLRHWNTMWMHHLAQADVDALVAANRLWDFTRIFIPGEGWKDRPDAPTPTADAVNRWSLIGFGHDGSNAGIVIQARCEREGVPHVCATCGGSASRERFIGQRKAAKKWKPVKPPRGPAWQIWETVSEGSPVTPAFSTAAELAEHYAEERGGSVESTLAWITGDGWSPSGIVGPSGLKTADQIITET